MEHRYRRNSTILLGIILSTLATLTLVVNSPQPHIRSIPRTISLSLHRTIITTLTEQFGKKVLPRNIIQLSEPDRRNLVLRINLKNPTGTIPKSLIFKQSKREASQDKDDDDDDVFDRFARDWAGLEFINKLKTKHILAPRLYGSNKEHRFILIEDMGEKHISLMEALLKADAKTAIASLERFALCLARFHGNCYKKTQNYLDILKTINPDAKSELEEMKEILDEAPNTIKKTLEKLSITFTKEMKREMKAVIRGIYKPGDFTTYIHNDISPENTFDDPGNNTMRIFDFEWSMVAHALVDTTYLRMSMPTSWVAYALPEAIIDSFEETYRQELVKYIPAAQDDKKYALAYVDACAYWMFKNIKLKTEAEEDEQAGRASIINRLQTFIDIAKRYRRRPNLQSMAEQFLAAIKTLWKDTPPLEIVTAFAEQ